MAPFLDSATCFSGQHCGCMARCTGLFLSIQQRVLRCCSGSPSCRATRVGTHPRARAQECPSADRIPHSLQLLPHRLLPCSPQACKLLMTKRWVVRVCPPQGWARPQSRGKQSVFQRTPLATLQSLQPAVPNQGQTADQGRGGGGGGLSHKPLCAEVPRAGAGSSLVVSSREERAQAGLTPGLLESWPQFWPACSPLRDVLQATQPLGRGRG